MSLTKYKEKRNFKESPEPVAGKSKSADQLAFVIQRHKASRLHYDFRLEMDGVLKSWAVPKGPSMDPGDKRLAMMVEDHPYDYKDFAGVIPSGYGAGIVEIWDSGTYTAIEGNDGPSSIKLLRAGLKAGNLKIKLKGKKLKGEFALVKLKGKEENTWLLIKHRDNYAVDGYDSENETPKNSPINKWLAENKKGEKSKVKSERSEKSKVKSEKLSSTKANKLKEAEDKAEAVVKKKVFYTPLKESRKLDKYVNPMLAKDSSEAFDDQSWIFEIKWDGFRAIAETGADTRLYSRNGNSFLNTYPVVVDALSKIKTTAILDGEIVVLNEEGFPDFQKIQDYENHTHLPLHYYVFDILSLKGKLLSSTPLLERKEILKKFIGKNDVIKFSDHIVGTGKEFFEVSIQKNLEGIMAKKADSHYYEGRRTNDWLKIKNNKTADVIIAGYTAPGGARNYFGSLVLAVKDGDVLKHAGNAGTGYDEKKLKDIYTLLQPLKIDDCPFAERIRIPGVTWVDPKYVCEVKFTEWTKDEKLRHPVFIRIREDKKTKDADMKEIKPVKKASTKIEKTVVAKQKVAKLVKEAILSKKPEKQKASTTAAKKSAPKKSVVKKSVSKKPVTKKDKKESDVATYSFGKISVNVSSPSKIYFPEDGVTKGMVAEYYQSVAEYILPYLKNRPQSLKRNPGGIHGGGFFHKDAGESAPSWVKSFEVHSESTNKMIDYIICNDKATLAYLNTLGCIELNPWHSIITKPANPDYLIIDIDPSDNNTFEQVIEAANHFKILLDKAGAKSFCKTSGASGLHIYVPMGKKYEYEQVKDFAHVLCMMVSDELPEFTTLERNLKKRGNDHMYLDYLQNRKGQTIASVYSLRPRIGATVSMPLLWKEVKPGLTPADFNIHNALRRIKKMGDIFSGVLRPWNRYQ